MVLHFLSSTNVLMGVFVIYIGDSIVSVDTLNLNPSPLERPHKDIAFKFSKEFFKLHTHVSGRGCEQLIEGDSLQQCVTHLLSAVPAA